MRASRGILIEEGVNLVALLAKRGGRGSAGKPGSHHDDAALAPVGRVDQFDFGLACLPDLIKRHILRCLSVLNIVAKTVEAIN